MTSIECPAGSPAAEPANSGGTDACGSSSASLQKPFTLGNAAWLRALEAVASSARRPERIFPVIIDELSRSRGSKPALISADETFSFSELASRKNQYARWTLSEGLETGAVVALLMRNRPEYLAIWLGISQSGCVTALLNSHLQGQALAHSIEVSGARHLVVEEKFLSSVLQIAPRLASAPKIWVHGNGPGSLPNIATAAGVLSGDALEARERRAVSLSDRALLIYTSGTTGYPKAANVSHHRILSWSQWFCAMLAVTESDRLYNCLPFYHAIGGVGATGAALLGGGSVFVRDRFSASSFWPEIRAQDCTIFQYIGELCRYLLKARPSSFERQHKLRIACGNGLGEGIWQPFKERFNIPHILEFYASTEANFSLFNADEEPGSIGRAPGFLAHRFPVKLIKVDPETLAPMRDPAGSCELAGVGEPGEAVFLVDPKKSAGPASFEGYTCAKASEQKLLRNVETPGDVWFRSGDLMRKDAKGHFYFAGRLGDTFRWKGENVSSLQVAHILMLAEGVIEAAVYGVKIEGADGRAGMAALVADTTFDLAALKAYLDRNLPRYAQPLFLRILPDLDRTGTFRPKKQALIAEGFDPAAIADPLYFNHPEEGEFVKLTRELFDAIAAGGTRL